MVESFIYENLKTVAEIAPGTRLALYEPEVRLYVAKLVNGEAAEKYRRIRELDSPALPKILTVAETEGGYEVVREYLSGESLAKVLAREKTLPEEKAAKYLGGILDGLMALHGEGLVHRDVNPNNVIITSDDQARLIDFGIVRSFSSPKSSDTAILGTPGYAAPEQFGFTQSDQRTDIYAVGVLLNVMLTGKLPKDALAGGRLGRVVRKCTEIDAEKRYRSASEVYNAIGAGNERPLPTGKFAAGLDKFIRAIPGLRSDKWWVVTLSAIWYLIAAMLVYFFFLGEEYRGFGDWALAILGSAMIMILPYFCYFNFLGVWDRIPLTRGATRKSQRLFYAILGTVFIVVGILIVPVME